MMIGVLGGIVGSIPVAYTAGWGAWSGCRTLVSVSRFARQGKKKGMGKEANGA